MVVWLVGCSRFGSSFGPPSGASPGLYSTTTGLKNLDREFGGPRELFRDDAVINYSNLCVPDTSFVVKKEWRELKSVPKVLPVGMPGGILLTRDGWAIDEAEVPNIEWKRYQRQLAAAGVSVAATEPLASALPVPDYFTNVFYDYYPVVGVSYEQVVAFCKWRGKAISYMINRSKPYSPDSLAAEHVVVESRLPTEAEWEQAALAKRGLPFGRKCTESLLEVNPKAATYFKQRSGTTAYISQIQSDIKAYNRTKPSRSFINYNQPEPYFLRLLTPAYVYGGPTNDYRLYNLLGNAAEMIQERGVAKGGSYRDPLAGCTVTSRSTYSDPSPTVGFRCMIRATQPNRK
ncbi:formylglycine-generating enzyme family protein [Hymenobacter ruricola]|uniref:SUMF1/EgtB/PvdO family nonheme iron enzyme n=1 Tax=Hymenobacter ruricola TaxID=2791023 RepID=A0ABS0I0T9_9BACT|nr:SUMF1/EgtB/PvdO family nonheme iron enzyme [Hymenobacter ruricola]MBF9220569.1 SUMF1/EgtB/PvdO family nonheme iron enzyme [Hymenobacter ruricola]